MAAKKGKASRKRKAAAAVAADVHAIKVGDRVRVVHGECGNAAGEVQSVSNGTAAVKLDTERRAVMPREFALSNLVPVRGNRDRV